MRSTSCVPAGGILVRLRWHRNLGQLRRGIFRLWREMVGASGFEPETFCTPSKRATSLRYAPFPTILQNKTTEVFLIASLTRQALPWQASLPPSPCGLRPEEVQVNKVAVTVPVTVQRVKRRRNEDFPHFSRTSSILSRSDFGVRGLDRAFGTFGPLKKSGVKPPHSKLQHGRIPVAQMQMILTERQLRKRTDKNWG